MDQNAFYTAAIQEPFTILGLRLRPLSLGHILLMNRVGSAFLSGDPLRYEDLAISVFICANRYVDALSALDDPMLPRSMLRWSQKLTRTRPIDRLLRRKPTPIDFTAKAESFRDYLRQGSWHPDFHSKSDEGNAIEAPPEHLIRIKLMRELGISETEIMDRSWSQCLTDFYLLRALDGSINIVDNAEIEEMLKKVEASFAKQNANNP